MKRFLCIFIVATTLVVGLVSIPLEASAACLCPGCSWKAIVLSDLHISGGNPERLDRIRHVVSDINAGEYGAINFVVVTGDAVATIQNDSGTQNYIEQLIAELGQLGTVPYHIALGNHDYRLNSSDDSDSQHTLPWILERERLWRDRISWFNGSAYESFDYNGCWKFIILNSYRGNYISVSKHINDQNDPYYQEGNELAWLSNELANAKQNDELVTIFMHHPLETDHFSSAWGNNLITPSTDPGFYDLLNTYQKTVKYIFVGHGHYFLADTLYGKINVRETASLGESSTKICKYPKYRAKADFNTNDHKPNCD